MRNFFFSVFFLTSLFLVGCETIEGMPGHIRSHQSSFDGAKELSVEPAMVYRTSQTFSGSDLMLGMFWRSTMEPNTFVISAHVIGTKLIQQSNSLQFNIDGRIVSLSSSDLFTQIRTQRGSPSVGIRPYNQSNRHYLISESFFKELIESDNVKIRLMLQNSYVEGDFSVNQASSARRAFIAFYEEYKKVGHD